MKEKIEDDIKVSICCLTYNHAEYIRNCLEGFLMQKASFSFEILVNDDASTDGTTQIIKAYEKKFPSIIKPLYQKENKFSKEGGGMNIRYNFPRAKGKYIALCEGDDYWTDPLKLQKQVDFLEKNKDFVIHSSNALCIGNSVPERKMVEEPNDKIFSLENFLTRNNIITCTVMFRNINIKIPQNLLKVTFGDWFLYVVLMQQTKGEVYRAFEVTAVYSIHSRSIMGSMNPINYNKNHISQIKLIANYVGRIERIQMEIINEYYLRNFHILLENKKYKEAIQSLLSNFWFSPRNFAVKEYAQYLRAVFI